MIAVQPTVRYTKTSDDVSIAYWTLGEGRPLVYMTGGPWNHLELWDVAACRRWYEQLASRRMLVRYDNRGTGHSERDVTEFSLDAQLRDLEATIAAVGAEHIDVFAGAGAGPVALTYAARNPERVGNMVLWCSWAATTSVRSPRIRAWLGLVDEDWNLMTDTCAHLVMGWSGGDAGRTAAERLRESVTPEVARAALIAAGEYDATTVLSQVTAPTLVLHRGDVPWLPVSVARDLAAGIPDARLTVLPGESTAPYVGDLDRAIAVVDQFLGGDTDATYADTQTTAAATPPAAPPDDLTEREVEVLRLLAGGNANKEMATQLHVSVRTVERHIANIYDKIGVRGRANATAYALTRGLV